MERDFILRVGGVSVDHAVCDGLRYGGFFIVYFVNRGVEVNASELSFMDSTGIGVLIGRYKRLKPRGVAIFLKSPTAAVDRVLGLSGIYEIMTKAG